MNIVAKVGPSFRRIFSTVGLKRHQNSDLSRWARTSNLDPIWESRARAVAQKIAPNSSVLDIGAGNMDLKKFIADGSYQPADIVKRCPECFEVDLNKGEFPTGKYDCITFLGVLEYIHDVESVLIKCASSAPQIVISYCVGRWFSFPYRLSMGWVNNFSRAILSRHFERSGYSIECIDVFKRKILHDEVIIVASRHSEK